MSTEAAPNPTAQTLPPQNVPNPAAPHPTADWTKPPVGHPDGPPPPKLVSLPSDYFAEMQGRLAHLSQIEQQRAADMEAAQAKENELLAAKGQVEQAFESERATWREKLQKEQEQLQKLRESFYGEKINGVLGEATNGLVFAGADDASRGEAARMLRSILKNDLEATMGPDGSVAVVDRASRRPAAEVLRERLSDPKLAFFFASTNRGGSGTDGTQPPANQQHSGPPSLLDEMLARHNAEPVLFRGVGLGPVSR